jgi:hypothetical protein
VIRLFSPVPEGLAAKAVNAEDYAARPAAVKPFEMSLVRVGDADIRVFEIGRPDPDRRGRPPAFQTATMNVLWIERHGAQDRTQLAPHTHEDFEEGALVLAGEYIQHLRAPWNADARQWRDDRHQLCGSRTLTIVPPQVVHTTEAQGPGLHIVLNIFSPARGDHIQSGVVLNANEYKAATAEGTAVP